MAGGYGGSIDTAKQVLGPWPLLPWWAGGGRRCSLLGWPRLCWHFAPACTSVWWGGWMVPQLHSGRSHCQRPEWHFLYVGKRWRKVLSGQCFQGEAHTSLLQPPLTASLKCMPVLRAALLKEPGAEHLLTQGPRHFHPSQHKKDMEVLEQVERKP